MRSALRESSRRALLDDNRRLGSITLGTRIDNTRVSMAHWAQISPRVKSESDVLTRAGQWALVGFASASMMAWVGIIAGVDDTSVFANTFLSGAWSRSCGSADVEPGGI
jgi:hypothetical protein